QGETTVHQRLPELRLRRIGAVEVHGVRVHGQQGEPGIVGFADRAPRAMLVDVADNEVVEEAAERFAIALTAEGRMALHDVDPWRLSVLTEQALGVFAETWRIQHR